MECFALRIKLFSTYKRLIIASVTKTRSSVFGKSVVCDVIHLQRAGNIYLPSRMVLSLYKKGDRFDLFPQFISYFVKIILHEASFFLAIVYARFMCIASCSGHVTLSNFAGKAAKGEDDKTFLQVDSQHFV